MALACGPAVRELQTLARIRCLRNSRHSSFTSYLQVIYKLYLMKAQDGVYCLPGSSTRILRLAAETELWGPHFSEAPRRAKQCKA